MTIRTKELTFEGGVNLDIDPHLLKANEWQLLQNMWPYKSKLIGSRPSLLHEQDILPVPNSFWDGRLFLNTNGAPTAVKYYSQWFRHLTPLKAIFLGELSRVAMVCVCNHAGVVINEHFEGEDASTVTLEEGEVILMIVPNDLLDATTYPTISAVRLGHTSNITPSLIEFNGSIIAANKNCEYVVKVVKSSSLLLPSATTWTGIDYRFTKIDFGLNNLDFRADAVIVYRNRFVYSKGNKIWMSDPFQPEMLYNNAATAAYLGIFFDTGLTEEVTAMTDLHTSALEEAGKSVLAVWTAHSMLIVQGEPAISNASTQEEIWTACNVTRIPITSGCVSQASIVKTKQGIIWCGADSVWFMARGNVPVEVGRKIGPRISEQSFESAGRIFATYDDECYRLIINKPGVGYNPYAALNEMWCLSFISSNPTKENASWFGPQVFTNTDNPVIGAIPTDGGEPGLFCCAKLVNVNDDRTWYIQPYSYKHAEASAVTDVYATRLGLCTISTYLGVDITAPYKPSPVLDASHYYYLGDIIQPARGRPASLEIDPKSYDVDYIVVTEGELGVTLSLSPIYVDELPTVLRAKRFIGLYTGAVETVPVPYKIRLESGNMTFDTPELVKLIEGYELTFKTLNPVIIKSNWWPWEPNNNAANIVTLQSKSNVPITSQNVLDALFNEPVLTARRVPAPPNKRYNGLTAQLNVEESDYRVIVANNQSVNPNWNMIRIATGATWYEFNLFDFDVNGIAKYLGIMDLMSAFIFKTLAQTGRELDIYIGSLGTGFKFVDGSKLYIDLTAQGWEWFGFVPTGLDNGHGVNIISNESNALEYLYPTGPFPFYTPHAIHMAKLSVMYDQFNARPR